MQINKVKAQKLLEQEDFSDDLSIDEKILIKEGCQK